MLMTPDELSPALIHRLMRPGEMAEDTIPINLDEAQQNALQIALSRLDEQDREILQLRYDANCTLDEIAAEFRLSPQIIEQREQDAINALRKHLPPTREDIASSPTRRYVPVPVEPTQDAPQEPQRSALERKISKEAFAAYMAEHPNALYRQMAKDLGVAVATVQRYRAEWLVDQAQQVLQSAQAPQPEPLPIEPPARVKEPTPPASYERTLYEEQVYQARLWMEMRERQWREAKEFTDIAEQSYLQAKANYERAKQIARAHFLMSHGQVIEDMED